MSATMIAMAAAAAAAFVTASLGLPSQSYHRHCKLAVRYKGTCLSIDNLNATECPSLGNISATDGHVLGYCDFVTSLDRNPNRVPEVLLVRKCKPECTKSCAKIGLYFCEQVYNYTTVKENGTESVMPVPSDCLCVKNTTHIRKIEELYGMKGP